MRNGFMKRVWFVMLFALAMGEVRVPAQQTPPAASSNQPAGRRPPQARTQPEFKDYNAAYATSGGAAMEKAADDFAAKYPSSELRPYLYAKAMREYQAENIPGKMLAMGEKVLTLDPDNAVALVLTATVLSDDLSDADPNRAQKIAEIKKNAQRAIETADTSVVAGQGTTEAQMAAYKNTLRSMAHSALAITALKTGDDAGAEKEFRVAADLSQAQPDPFIWYHLALAQDHQGKYPEAVVSVQQALRYTGSNPDLGKLAEGELRRLQQLTGQPSAGSAPQTGPQPSPSRPPQ
jgi:tetratricopeptide (TPR) repeat protein